MAMRDVLKAGAERLLVASGAPGRRIRGGASGTVILSYHNVVPRGESAVGDRSLHIDQARFGAHLDRILDTHDVVPLSAVEPGGAVSAGRPRAVVTFDDAYVGTVTAGFEELARRDLPATVFVPPGLLGAEGFWWDRLAPGGEGLAEAARNHALDALGGRHREVLDWATAQGMPLADLPPHARPASFPVLARAVATGRFSVGSHTWTHVNLAGVPLDEAVAEMRRGHAWLGEEARDLPGVDWIAYPYGRSSAEVEAAAAAVARWAVRVEGGAAEVRGRWVAADHRLPRINVPAGLSPDGLTLRLAGLR